MTGGHDHVDDETLAALLDGKLSPPERARVMRVIAERPEVYADFIEAAQVAAELAAAPAANVPQVEDVIPIHRPGRRPWRGRLLAAIPLVAAAGIAGVLVLSPSSAAPDAIAILQQATVAPSRGSGSISDRLGARWDEPGWSVTRGAESTEASTGTVARIGARVAQLELAARASDTAAYQRVLGALQPLLVSLTGASPIAARLAELPMEANPERATVVRQLREVGGTPEAFDAGAVLEAARLGITSDNPAFLGADGEGRLALRAISETLERSPPAGDWTVLRAQLRAITSLDATDTAALRARVDSAVAAIPR